MYRDWPFFRGLIGTLEMALFKTDLGVGERYLCLVDDDIAERFWDDLRPSTRASSSAFWRSPGRSGCWTRRPRCSRAWSTATRGSIRCRTCRSSSCAACAPGREEAKAPLLATITGIAAGMRNTG